jgi:mono/diheme cytochrome c family protein
MAATDKPYRNQYALDIVFGVSCVLMLAGIIWMFAQDYYREFKVEQRDFRDVEEAIADRQMLALVPDDAKRKQIDAALEQLAEARRELQQVKSEEESLVKDELVQKAKSEARAQSLKADYDSRVSIYNIEVEKRDSAAPGSSAWTKLDKSVEEERKNVDELARKLAEAQAEVDAINRTLADVKTKHEFDVKRGEQTVQLTEKAASDQVDQAEKQLKDLTDSFDRFAKLAIQKRWKLGDMFRALPVLDAFASPTRIQQYTLTALPIDYNFKEVTRFDRCTTCHQGIDRPVYDKETLTKLTERPTDEDAARLKNAEEMLAERNKVLRDQKASINPSDLRLRTISPSELTPARVNEYCAHPRLDLFVDNNSPHPAERFGCTVCHAGQGSATEFILASHTPNDFVQKERWIKDEGWEANHFWDFPMLPNRFQEAACLKCHHQVTDLMPAWNQSEIRQGKQVDAPGTKVVRGYNLVREFGCFGCHEIAGAKDGRWVGPDLRLEPSPPVDALSPSERLKAFADPLNPPGAMRKVGPSLRRIREKTNEQWARRWLEAPREFRPDTKMPHFYNVSNNSPESLPDDQKKFPDAEVYSIVYYLFRESGDYLAGKDTAYRFLKDREKELKDKLKNNLIAESERKDLEEIERRLQVANEYRYLKEREEELQPKEKAKQLTEPERKELEDARVRLRTLKPLAPIREQMLSAEGEVAQLPSAPADDKARQEQIKSGRQLFTEKGCLACHSHEGTFKPLDKFPGVVSEQDFGPNLSQIAAKIAPNNGDPEGKRRWLVQWIMNPNVHFPRTRMPITHLTPTQASDVAEWLLSQPVGEWKVQDPPAPEADALERLARIYLEKTMGRRDAEDVLKDKGLTPQQTTQIRQQHPDADELRLANGASDESWDDKLKWYIGRKAISSLGCFGCHDIPGFELAKPIGTPLNDWGKKDPERLAFEDVVAYVKDNYHLVDGKVKEDGHGYGSEDGKQPYERFFFDSLEHHQRQGFLNQKLREPRSYDFNRMRTWDDRLRMPQFRFARKIKPLEGETEEQAREREEAEARDAVMTFVLGLVAEPVPLAFLNDPKGDRLAEAKGKQVLEKYNCAGCHQLQPGIYDFNTRKGTKTISNLENGYNLALTSRASDLPFDNHNAWVGVPSPIADRVRVHGLAAMPNDEGLFKIRLTQAVRYTKKADDVTEDQQLPAGTYDIPAATPIEMATQDLALQADRHGGVLTELLVPYLVERKPSPYLDDDEKARSGLPPPLLREGEKVQPTWLFQFLKNPYMIRPVAILRMPKFNMSDDDAMTLVNYFAAVDRRENPGIGLNYPYEAIPQRSADYLGKESQEYVAGLGRAAVDQRIEEQKLQSLVWERLLNERISDVGQEVKAAEAQLGSASAADKRGAQKKLDALKEQLKKLSDESGKKTYLDELRKSWEQQRAFATDAYRLLANYNLCLSCHEVGTTPAKQQIGPVLTLTEERLRPDWTFRWIANPQRLLIYPKAEHPMPQNFPANKTQYQDLFVGTPREQAAAVRAALMNYAKVAEIPENRFYRPPAEAPTK